MPPRFTPRFALSSLFLALLAAASLSACGGGSAAGAGGSSSSSDSSATGTGGAVPQARVIVRDPAGRPAVGVDVVVHDPAGLTTQQTKTDKTGKADVDLVPGGGVTALFLARQDIGDPEYDAVSVMGLAAGTEVRLVADVASPSDVSASMPLSFVGVPPLQSTAWNIVSSCLQESNTSEQIFTYEACRGSSTYDLVAFLAPGDQRIVFPAQPVQPGTSVAYKLDPATAEAAPAVAVDVTGAPAGTTLLTALLSANRPEGGKTRYLASHDAAGSPDATLQMARLFVSPGGSFDVDIGAETDAGGVHTRLYFSDKDLPTSSIPWHVPTVPPVVKMDTLTVSASRPVLSWELDAAAIPGDAVRLQLEYTAPDDPSTEGGSLHPARWTLYIGSTLAGTAKFPVLPPAFAAFTPDGPMLAVFADQLDIPGKNSLIAVVNAEFDRAPVSWASAVFSSPGSP
jgi:hypothetical protein